MATDNHWELLKNEIKGEVKLNIASRILYATDASVYQQTPLAVVIPKDKDDISKIISFANEYMFSIIPRGAGTSLAGQVVGDSIVVDISHFMNEIIEINPTEKWVEVEPGVVLDDLNREVAKYGLFFGPETSTANRCTMAGMVGNNSCGSHSMIYGSTRDHIIEVSGFLSNGDEVTFGPLTNEEFEEKCKLENLEGEIYRFFKNKFSDKNVISEITKEFPHSDIKRRNTGYAIDILADSSPFSQSDKPFNIAKLIAGSEGTLMFITSIKLSLINIPPKDRSLLVAHFETLQEALKANMIAVNHKPDAVELMDNKILELTKDNTLQRQNRFFVEGEPGALLIIEFSGDTEDSVTHKIAELTKAFQSEGYGYSFPIISGDDMKRVWDLRKAGLGVLSNMRGGSRPVSLIEDTAVRVEDLPNYVKAIDAMLAKYGKDCVYHAHAGSGELHIRPVLDLKKPTERSLFRKIGRETAEIVKAFGGSLSGEHGDGRLRGEFIEIMVGKNNYQLIKDVKRTFDPNNVLNPGKITDTPPMDESFRYVEKQNNALKNTVFNWSYDGSLLEATERCNGSGDCLKSSVAGGAMCPSYQATRNEMHSTRGRANMLRSFLQGENRDISINDLSDALDLCLSCKACKNECPSSVDMARLKAEFLQYIYDENGTPLSARLMGSLPTLNRVIFPLKGIYNYFISNRVVKFLLLKVAGISPKRALPKFGDKKVVSWAKKNHKNSEKPNGKVVLLIDEFTNVYDTQIGVKTILLLDKLGFEVVIAPIKESGRIQISKGLLRKAKKIANRNIVKLENLITDKIPFVGIEPSTILTFRDEYPDLVTKSLKSKAQFIAKNSLTIEEFLARKIDEEVVKSEQFKDEVKEIKFHTHCHQKSLSNSNLTKKVLSLPKNYKVSEIRSGCCGMAGSFGYEDNHYDLSMKIGEMVLFPVVRATKDDVQIVTSGHSCRHQIKDGTDRDAVHTVEVLYDAMV